MNVRELSNDFEAYRTLVPKDLKKNLEFRAEMVKLGASSREQAHHLWQLCRRDPLFYISTFCFILEPRIPQIFPFIPYEFQELAIEEIISAIGDHDLVIEKSRDMGASWMCLTCLEWAWHFHDMFTFLVLSRKEHLVEKKGDPKALFSKIDFIHDNQPRWLLPSKRRAMMHMRNEETGATLDGDSTHQFAGVADRRTAMLLDEFSKMENQDIIFRGTRDVTDCRIFNFTPQGASNIAAKIAQNPKFRKITLHWSIHPIKAKGLYTSDGNGNLEILDTDYEFPDDYPFICDGKKRSPWYDKQCDRAEHPSEIAQELDIDYLGSSFQYFLQGEIESYIEKYAKDPYRSGDLIFDQQSGDFIEWVDDPNGLIKLWVNLDPADNPLQDRTYSFGVDVSEGTGASNSCIVGVDRKTGEQVFEMTTPYMRSEELAAYMHAIGRWFRGNDGMEAFVCWEATGPGRTFGSVLLERGYTNFYRRPSNEESITKKISDIPGWWPTKSNKKEAMANYRRKMKSGEFIPRSHPQLEECRYFIYTQTGWVIHSSATDNIDPSGANESHGDRPTAAAIAVMNLEVEPMGQIETNEIRPGSLAHRRELARKEAELMEMW